MNNKYEFIYQEVNQSRIRLVLVCIIIMYVHFSAYYYNDENIVGNQAIILLFILAALVEYLWARKFFRNNKVTSHNIIFRITSNVIDNVLLAFLMIMMGFLATPLFFIYLWITFGIGIRYGVNYLIFSAFLNMLSFSFVIYMSPAWHNENVILISAGLLTSLIVLPAYVSVLIKKLENALEEKQKAFEFKQNILANVNHELRTPLNSILNVVEIIRDQHLSGINNYLLGMISNSANSVLDMVNSILDISKIEADEYIFETKLFNFYDLIQDVIFINHPLAMKKNIDLYFYINPRVEPCYIGSPNELKIIINNLVSNAIKFTEIGCVSVNIELTKDKKHEQEISILIHDTGIGIPKDKIDEIFEPFAQINSIDTNCYRGTGLGMSIASEFTKIMRGKIHVDSVLDEGTETKLQLVLSKNVSFNAYKEVPNLNLIVFGSLIKNSSILQSLFLRKYNMIYHENDSPISELKNYDKKIIVFEADLFHTYAKNIQDYIRSTDAPKLAIYNDLIYKNKYIFAITSVYKNDETRVVFNSLDICSKYHSKLHSKAADFPISAKKLKILIAEDDPITTDINKMLFRKTKHSVDYVCNGIQVLEYINKYKYDLVIIDLHLPDMLGTDIAKIIKNNSLNHHPPFILLTADIQEANDIAAKKYLFADILIKPITFTKLLTRIYTILKIDYKTSNNTEHKITLPVNIDEEMLKNNYKYNLLDEKILNEHVNIAGAIPIKRLIKSYDVEVREYLKILSLEMKKDNYFEIKKILHKLQGTSLTVGALIFGKNVMKLQRLIRYEKFGCLNDDHRSRLEKLHFTTINQIELYINNMMKNFHVTDS